jgi:RNA polymerase sigma factor (sigma-70 family)
LDNIQNEIEPSFTALWEQYHGYLWTIALSLTHGVKHDANDLLNTACVNAKQRFFPHRGKDTGGFRPGTSFKAWARSVVRSTWKDQNKAWQRDPLHNASQHSEIGHDNIDGGGAHFEARGAISGIIRFPGDVEHDDKKPDRPVMDRRGRFLPEASYYRLFLGTTFGPVPCGDPAVATAENQRTQNQLEALRGKGRKIPRIAVRSPAARPYQYGQYTDCTQPSRQSKRDPTVQRTGQSGELSGSGWQGEDDDRHDRAFDLIAKLPRRQRLAVELRKADLSTKEIAAQMGVGINSVTNYLHHATVTLRTTLAAVDEPPAQGERYKSLIARDRKGELQRSSGFKQTPMLYGWRNTNATKPWPDPHHAVRPARPERVVVFRYEPDAGDLADMASGADAGMGDWEEASAATGRYAANHAEQPAVYANYTQTWTIDPSTGWRFLDVVRYHARHELDTKQPGRRSKIAASDGRFPVIAGQRAAPYIIGRGYQVSMYGTFYPDRFGVRRGEPRTPQPTIDQQRKYDRATAEWIARLVPYCVVAVLLQNNSAPMAAAA